MGAVVERAIGHESLDKLAKCVHGANSPLLCEEGTIAYANQFVHPHRPRLQSQAERTAQ